MIDTDFVMVTGPYPAESSTITSPPLLVTPMASPKARQGFAIEQLNEVLAVKPYEATKVRWGRTAAAGEARRARANAGDANAKV